jgi:hypothetical protein
MRYNTAVLGAAAFYASEVVAFPAAAIQYAANAERMLSLPPTSMVPFQSTEQPDPR